MKKFIDDTLVSLVRQNIVHTVDRLNEYPDILCTVMEGDNIDFKSFIGPYKISIPNNTSNSMEECIYESLDNLFEKIFYDLSEKSGRLYLSTYFIYDRVPNYTVESFGNEVRLILYYKN